MKIKFSKKQKQVFRSFNRRLNILVGAIRSGKTYISIPMFLKKLHELGDGNGEIVIIGKTERTVLRNIINPLFKMLGDEYMSYTRGTGELRLFGYRIYVIGANDDRAEAKIRGMTIILALGDEITLWPENFFVQLLGRMSPPNACFIGTTNPDSPFHWFKKKFIDRGIQSDEEFPLDLEVFHFTLDDNIALAKEYKENIKREYTGVWYKRFILGLWCIAEGLIYDSFDSDINIYPNDLIAPYPPLVDYWCAIDYGTGTTTAFGLFGEDRKGRVYLLREWRYEPAGMNVQKTDAQFVMCFEQFLHEYEEEIRSKFDDKEARQHLLGDIKRLPVFCDPSAASLIAAMYDAGWKFVLRANNKVLDGIRAVSTAFSERQFFIHESCKGWLLERSTYAWDEKAQEKGEDKPIKKNDHSLDMSRYGYFSRKVPRKGYSHIVSRTRQ